MRLDRYKFVAELFGRRDGQNRGAGFDFHLCDMSGPGRIGLSIGTLGSPVPQYVGFAYALKVQKKDEIVVVIHGDGGMSEGTCYEAMNIGSLYGVPLVLVIDNNEWAMSTPLSRQSNNPNISDRGKPFNLPAQIVDGSDIIAVREAMDVAVVLARKNQMNIVEIKNKRWGPHYIGQNEAYRHDMDDIEKSMKNRDAIKIYEARLLEEGVCDDVYFEKMKKKASEEIEELIMRASKAEYPTFDDIYKKEHIYMTPETGGNL
jgi:pyruvate dehydrogenase E1 component alpha subunit